MRNIILLLISILIVRCGVQPFKKVEAEKRLCDSLKIDPSIMQGLRQYSYAEVELFHYSFSRQINEDGSETELEPFYLPGLVFKETAVKAEHLLEKLHDNFMAKGYTLFIIDKNFGIDDKPDVMAILKTTDKYEILSKIQTNGINYDIDTDSLLQIIKVLDTKYSLNLVGASGDWCEFKIEKEPTDWLTFANEAYTFCPDIVDQGTGSVEELAEEMKKQKRIFLWWD